MKNDKVIGLENPEKVEDPLTDMLRSGAQKLIKKAVEAELAEFLAQYADDTDEQGRQAVVRNGYQPERQVLTGLGEVDVQLPKTRDRSGQGRHFRSHILPPYIKRARSVDNVLPWLYLKGISTGDMSEALASLLGEDAGGLSPGTLSRLKQSWLDDYKSWCQRDLNKKYVYVWADGIYFNVRGVNSDSEKSGKVFTLNRNRCSRRAGMSVHLGPEYALGENTRLFRCSPVFVAYFHRHPLEATIRCFHENSDTARTLMVSTTTLGSPGSRMPLCVTPMGCIHLKHAAQRRDLSRESILSVRSKLMSVNT